MKWVLLIVSSLICRLVLAASHGENPILELELDDQAVISFVWIPCEGGFWISESELTHKQISKICGSSVLVGWSHAGAYNSDMGYIVKSIKVLTPELEVITMYNNELEFHYRTSFLKTHPNYICLEATIALRKGDTKAIMEVISERKKRRIESQPLEFPSAGSVFRNPKDDYAGRLIENLNYKGYRIGDAEVSKKHANFIINRGSAKGEDIKMLITQIQKDVKKKYGIDLIVEQEFVD